MLILVRHGEANYNNEDIYGHVTGNDLTTKGTLQMNLLALRLKDILTDKEFTFYSSDSSRAMASSLIIAEKLNKRPSFTKELRSTFNGTDLVLLEDVNKTYKPGIDWRPKGDAESWREHFVRISNFMNTISQDINILIVTHGNPVIAAVQWWLGFDEKSLEKHFFMTETENAGITMLDFNQKGDRNIICLNEKSHLSIRSSE